jgi:hypothetical protein
VPRQKVTLLFLSASRARCMQWNVGADRGVDEHGLVDVDCDKVVEASARTGGKGGINLGGLLGEASHSISVLLALALGEGAPRSISIVRCDWDRVGRRTTRDEQQR